MRTIMMWSSTSLRGGAHRSLAIAPSQHRGGGVLALRPSSQAAERSQQRGQVRKGFRPTYTRAPAGAAPKYDPDRIMAGLAQLETLVPGFQPNLEALPADKWVSVGVGAKVPRGWVGAEGRQSAGRVRAGGVPGGLASLFVGAQAELALDITSVGARLVALKVRGGGRDLGAGGAGGSLAAIKAVCPANLRAFEPWESEKERSLAGHTAPQSRRWAGGHDCHQVEERWG